jgi:acyl-CoA thioester hydrolase
MAQSFTHRLRVRYVECDMQGIVFNAHFYTWMDIAHTELWREAIGPVAGLYDRGCDFVVAESSARFRAPARFDQEVDVVVALESLGSTAMTTTHTFYHQNDLLVEGRVRHVCVDSQSWTKTPWPDDVRAALTPYVGVL